jgi:hypothetical protein
MNRVTPRRVIDAAIVVVVLAGTAMHLVAPINPLQRMLSDSVVAWPGAVLLGTACAALVVVAGVLAAAARRGPRPRLVPALLAVWATALVAIVVFPTNLPGTELTNAAVVHRWGAAIVAVVPPLVGLLMARSRAARTAAWATAGGAALFGAAHGPAVLLGGDVVPYGGLAERALFAMMLVLLALIGRDLSVQRAALPALVPAARPQPVKVGA